MDSNKTINSKDKKKFDLENGKTSTNFIKIWLPTIVAQLIGGSFIVFDTIFVSHGYHSGSIGRIWSWNSGDPYAGMGPSGTALAMPYTLIIVSIGLLIGGGLANKIITLKAKGDDEGVQKSINSLTPIVLIYGTITTVVLLVFAKFFIWMGSGFQTVYLDNWYNNPLFHPENEGNIINGAPNDAAYGQIFAQAAWYLRIQAIGAIPYIYMISSQVVLRTEGKTNVAMRYTGTALFVNILLDFTMINVLGLNLVGAAIATVIAQTIAASLYYNYYRKTFPVKITEFDWENGKHLSTKVPKYGFSTMFLQLTSAIILISFTMSIGIVNYSDPNLASGYTSAFQGYFSFFTLSALFVNGTAQSMAPLINYNYHKERHEKVKEARNIGFSIILIWAFSVSALIIFYPNVTGIFGTPSIGKFYQQRISQIMFLTFMVGSLILGTAIFLQATQQRKKAMIILILKASLIFPIALALGFAFKGSEPGFKNWSWSSTQHTTTGSLIMFYTVPLIDLLLFPYVLYTLWREEKKLNSNDKIERFPKDEKELKLNNQLIKEKEKVKINDDNDVKEKALKTQNSNKKTPYYRSFFIGYL